jgi:hypothetical protein
MPGEGQASEISGAKNGAVAKGGAMRACVAETLSDAPRAQTSTQSQAPANTSSSAQPPAPPGTESGVIAILPPAISRKRLTAGDKFLIYAHQNFGPQNFILPAFQAGFSMLHPPPNVPRQWEDGGGALGRWYGEQIAASTTRRTAQLLAEVALHEDPRYVPSGSENTLMRIGHAVAFTFVDKTDSGHNTFALSNFAGAAAGGFAGMVLLPNGYNDLAHAERRALRGLGSVAVRNIITEFRPQWAPILRKIHIPKILPEWWTPKHSQHS